VSDARQVESLVRETLARAGGLDVLVAAAGIGGGLAETAEYAEADFERVLAVNLCGVFYAMKYAIRAMLAGRGGAIVTVASAMGLVGLPRTPAYSAAKGGVVQLTRVAALEYARRGIRVNCICPGVIDTPMVGRATPEARAVLVESHPMGRMGTADEVAEAALYLASDASSFTTGAVLPVDGGFVAQ
jgi:NAD(P)-dependent dehydrogenase (short-subunit alcohol dehydrogenase family)